MQFRNRIEIIGIKGLSQIRKIKETSPQRREKIIRWLN